MVDVNREIRNLYFERKYAVIGLTIGLFIGFIAGILVH
jgi:hypothetical protein